MSERDKVRETHSEGREEAREGMAEPTVPSHHGNPFDMQLPYLLPISELYSSFTLCLRLKKGYKRGHV